MFDSKLEFSDKTLYQYNENTQVFRDRLLASDPTKNQFLRFGNDMQRRQALFPDHSILNSVLSKHQAHLFDILLQDQIYLLWCNDVNMYTADVFLINDEPHIGPMFFTSREDAERFFLDLEQVHGDTNKIIIWDKFVSPNIRLDYLRLMASYGHSHLNLNPSLSTVGNEYLIKATAELDISKYLDDDQLGENADLAGQSYQLVQYQRLYDHGMVESDNKAFFNLFLMALASSKNFVYILENEEDGVFITYDDEDNPYVMAFLTCLEATRFAERDRQQFKVRKLTGLQFLDLAHGRNIRFSPNTLQLFLVGKKH